MSIKVLIVDDQELMRDSLGMLIDSDRRFTVAGLADNGRDAITIARKERPEIVLMDIRMPEIDGIECLKVIKQDIPGIKVIMLTTFDSDENIYHALKNGADGFLLKGISKKDLINSIITVRDGGASIDPKTAQRVFEIFERMAKSILVGQGREGLEELSPHELRIIQLIGRGMSNKEIMNEIHFSEGTIRNYISNILRKLDLRDRTQVAIFAIQSGIMLKNFDI